MTDYRAIPKVELHLHLEGAAQPELVRRLAGEKSINLNGLFAEDGGYAWSNFTEFLRAYDAAAQVFDTPEAHRDLAEAVLSECAANGVVYAELFLSPDHSGADPARWTEVLAAISEGADAAEEKTGIVARYIPLCVRNLGPELAERAAALAVGSGDSRVVGFGMAGDERRYAPADFARAYDIARDGGLKLTAHAGEFGGAESVREALDHLRLDRVDHGVRAVDDTGLVDRLVAEEVPLAICPGSNISLGVFPKWSDHSIDRLWKAGVKVNVSTDDPPFFETTMTDEYAKLSETFGYGRAELLALSQSGLDAAFCGPEVKAAVGRRLI